jgi:hypothetical protein
MKNLIFLLLFSTTNSLIIDCVFSSDNIWEPNLHYYDCAVKSSQFGFRQNRLEGFTGTHVSGKSNRDVKGVYFVNNCDHIKTVPIDLDLFFPNLTGVSFLNCGIEELVGNELTQYKNLRVANFMHTKIKIVGPSFNVPASLPYFGLMGNPCIDENSWTGNRELVIALLDKAKRVCV